MQEPGQDAVLDPIFAVQIVMDGATVCIRTAGGDVVCTSGHPDYPRDLGYLAYDGADAVDVSLGGHGGDQCIVTRDGGLLCIDGKSSFGPRTKPLEHLDLHFVDAAVGRDEACALSDGGEVWCGEIGNHYAPTKWSRVDTVLTGVVAMDVDEYLCVIYRGGNVSCPGAWLDETLRDMTRGQGVDVDMGEADTACVRTRDGNVYCEGLYYQAWDPSPDHLENDAADFSLSTSHMCVVTSEGAVVCQGSNDDHQSESMIADSSAVAVATSFGNTCVLVVSGDVTCWGRSFHGAERIYPERDPCPEVRLESVPYSGLYGLVIPMGAMQGTRVTPIADQTWLWDDSGSFPWNIASPANGVVTRIEDHSDAESDHGAAEGDWTIIIEHGCYLTTIFTHVNALGAELEAPWAGATGGRIRHVSVDVGVGQWVGHGTEGSIGFGFGLRDTRETLERIVNPARYEEDALYLHAVDPYPYFEPRIASYLEDHILGSGDPAGGRVDYDVPGRLAGNWFRANDSDDVRSGPRWKDQATFAYDHIDPSVITVSLGDWAGQARQWFVRDNAPDPTNVSVRDGVVVYEVGRFFEYHSDSQEAWDGSTYVEGLNVASVEGATVEGTILVELVDDATLRMETFPGQNSTEIVRFSEDAWTYVR